MFIEFRMYIKTLQIKKIHNLDFQQNVRKKKNYFQNILHLMKVKLYQCKI